MPIEHCIGICQGKHISEYNWQRSDGVGKEVGVERPHQFEGMKTLKIELMKKLIDMLFDMLFD